MVRTAALLLAAAALMACSTVKVAYNNAASLTYWWLDGYLDLDGAQSLKVREDLAALLDWHRHEELPKLSTLLQRAAALTPRDMTPEQVCGFADDIRARLLAVAERAEPTSAEVASTLSPAQLEHLERKYAKNNADFRSDWLARSPAAQKEKRLDQFVERAEDFYGTLDAAQRELLRQRVQQSVWNARLLDAERRRRQQETLALLRRVQAERMPVADVRVALRGLVQRIAEAPPGPWREHQAAQVQEGCRNIAALHNSTSTAQRERAARRLADYDADVRELAAQP